MSPDHPILLVFAVLPTIPFLPPLARFFFRNRDQFAEDLGLTTPEGRWALLMDYFMVNYRNGSAGLRGIFLNVIWFLVVWAALIATAYHLLVFLTRFLS